MNVGILFSGGKDSTYAAWLARKKGYEVSCFITLVSKNKESYMFHTPAIELCEKQAKLAGVDFVVQKTEGKKEEELEDLKKAIKKAIKKNHIQGIVTGAIESVYQATRIQQVCNEFEIECFNPLWQKNAEEHWREMIKQGFKIIITSVSAEGLGKEWLGREIDNAALEKLIILSKKYNFHLAFEGGEAETLVINCPMFKKKLEVEIKDVVGEGNAWGAMF